jgi:hypothetical protein
MDTLCTPCPVIDTSPSNTTVASNSQVYINQSNNLPDIMKKYYMKDCRPNYFVESGNSNNSTATDKFDQSSYNTLVASIQNDTLIPPGEP